MTWMQEALLNAHAVYGYRIDTRGPFPVLIDGIRASEVRETTDVNRFIAKA